MPSNFDIMADNFHVITPSIEMMYSTNQICSIKPDRITLYKLNIFTSLHIAYHMLICLNFRMIRVAEHVNYISVTLKRPSTENVNLSKMMK